MSGWKTAVQRCFWNPVYDRFARLYDAVDWFTGDMTHHLRRRALAHLPVPPARVLEVGMGTGKLHLELALRYELAGLDLAPGMVRRTSLLLARAGQRSGLCEGSVYAIPWPDETFDAVVSTFAFSAFADGERALNEMIRVTRSGGSVIILDAGEAEDDNFMAYLLAQLWSGLGDFMRDERALMAEQGLTVMRQDFGPWHSVHVVVGKLRETQS